MSDHTTTLLEDLQGIEGKAGVTLDPVDRHALIWEATAYPFADRPRVLKQYRRVVSQLKRGMSVDEVITGVYAKLDKAMRKAQAAAGL